MKQVYKSGAIAAAPAASGATSEGNPTEGDVANNVPATVIGDYAFYQLYKELEAVIEDGGLSPDKAVLTQVRDALRAKYVAKTDAASGGVTGAADAKAADYTILSTENGKTFVFNASSAPLRANLPDLGAADDGFTATVIKTDNSANAVTADGHGGDTLNGGATYALTAQYESVILKWTGTEWLAIGGASPSLVRALITALVGGAPDNRNTLGELATALAALESSAGGITGTVSAKTADYNVVAADDGKTTSVDASTGAKTVNLPDLGASDDGFTHTVIKTDNSANAVTIDGHGADTINGAATLALGEQWENAVLKWTGTEWITLGGATGAQLRDFFGGASDVTTSEAGAQTITWAWDTPKGLLILSGGGGGGSNFTNSDNATNDSVGGQGGPTTYLANSAPGGGYGGRARFGLPPASPGGPSSDGITAPTVPANSNNGVGGAGGDGAAAGAGAKIGNVEVPLDSGPGGPGRILIVPLNGMTKGDVLNISVGAGGAAAPPLHAGALPIGAALTNATAGTAGWARAVPLY